MSAPAGWQGQLTRVPLVTLMILGLGMPEISSYHWGGLGGRGNAGMLHLNISLLV